MKKLVLILLFGITGTIGVVSQTLDQYWEFTNLYAADDTSGLTHLYYAQMKTRIHNCHNGYDYNIVEDRSTIHRYHNPSINADSVFIPTHDNVVMPGCYGGGGVSIIDFHPFEGSPEHVMFYGGYSDGHEIYGYLQVGNFSFYLAPHFYYFEKVVANPNLGKFIFLPFHDHTLRVPLTENQDTIRVLNDYWYMWHDYNWNDYDPIDSLDGYFKGYDYILLSLSRFNDSLAFYQKNGSIYRSNNLGESGERLEAAINQNSQFHYDADSLHIYVTRSGSHSILVSDNYGKAGSWNSVALPSYANFFSVDTDTPGLVFYTDSSHIYHSTNFANTFEVLYNFKKWIKGYYKKPNSNIHYVLFEDELVELKGDEINVLKKTGKKESLDITPNNIPYKVGDEFTYRIIEGSKNGDQLTYYNEVEDFKMKVSDVSIVDNKHQITFKNTTSRPFFSELTINNHSTIATESRFSQSKFSLFKNDQHVYKAWTYKGEQDSALQYVIVKDVEPQNNLGIEDTTTSIYYYIEESTDTTDVIGSNSIQLKWSDTFGITLLTFNTDTLRYKLRGTVLDGAVYGDTTRTLIVSNESKLSVIPKQITLEQNYPNPFNPTTNIWYHLKNNGYVLLEVYDALGKKVQTLVDGYLEAGSHYAMFDANELASGIYFYRLEADGEVRIKRMTLIK